jgi:hypothetical protein
MKGRGIAVFYAARLLGGWLISSPIATLVAGSGIGDFPEGDALLFQPGGTYLFEVARVVRGSLGAAFETSLFLFALSAFASLLALSALLVALDAGERLSLGEWSARAVEQLPRFTLFAGAALFLQSIVVGACALLWVGARELLYRRYDERSADLTSLLVLALGVLGVVALGLLHDLARAAAVRHRASARAALKAALAATRARPLATLGAWLMPLSWSIAAFAAGAIAVGRVRVEGAGEWRVSAVTLIHQLVILALVCLRALWLKRALELVGSKQDRDQALAPSV